MKSVLDIWRNRRRVPDPTGRGSRRAARIPPFERADHAELVLILNRIVRINEELKPWQNRFSNTLGDATRWIKSTLLLVIVTVAGTLVPIGIYLTQRMVSRVDHAERELKELKLGQEYAMKLAYQRATTSSPIWSPGEFENRLKQASRRSPRRVAARGDVPGPRSVQDSQRHVRARRRRPAAAASGALLSKRCAKATRWRGWAEDEFGVLLESCPMQEAIRIAHELRQCVADFRFVGEGKSFNIGASIGVTTSPTARSTSRTCSALPTPRLHGKEKGRNRVQFYRPHDSEVFLRRARWNGYRGSSARSRRGGSHCTRRRSSRSRTPDHRPFYHELLVRMLDEHDKIIPPWPSFRRPSATA